MWRSVDLVLRFIYVAAAPLLLVPIAMMIPITGILISGALATVIALFGTHRWHAKVDRLPVVGRALGNMARLGDFYNEHPPKPLVYYVCSPVLLPGIVCRRVPRRELMLYRKLSAVALVVVVAGGIWDYLRHWRPELPLSVFLAATIVGLVLQLIGSMVIVMPIVTTIITLHQRNMKRTLAILFACATLSGVLVAVSVHRTHGMPIGTWTRIQARTSYASTEYHKCLKREANRRICGSENPGFVAVRNALNAAVTTLTADPTNRDVALDKAHQALEEFYKPDEAAEFRLYADQGVYMLFIKFGREPPLYTARDAQRIILDTASLPAAARKLLGK